MIWEAGGQVVKVIVCGERGPGFSPWLWQLSLSCINPEGCPGSGPAQSICFRKVEFYQHVINFFHQCCWLVYQRPCHVLSCLCGNARKRTLAICCKSRALRSISSLLFVPIYVLNRDINMMKKQPNSEKNCQRNVIVSIALKNTDCLHHWKRGVTQTELVRKFFSWA